MITNIGLIGAGSVVENYHLPVLSQMPGVSVRWVVDKDLARAKSIAKLFGIPLAAQSIADCEDVDVVLIATPVATRRELVAAACHRGWHALCEKPFAATAEDHRSMVEAARSAGVRMGVGLMRRYYEMTDLATRLVRHRVLGEVLRVIAGEGAWLRRTGRGADWYQGSALASGGGALAETGSHTMDQIFAICGVEGFEIANCNQVVAEGLELETNVEGAIHIAGGLSVPLSVVVTRLADVYNGIVIRCENGDLRVPVVPNEPIALHARDGKALGVVGAPPASASVGLYRAIAGEWRSFISATRNRTEMTDWDTGLLTTSFIEECYRLGSLNEQSIEVRP